MACPQLVKANQWHNAGGLQSFVSPEAVVFKFPGSNQKAVALPARQRFVVIALNALHVQVPERTVQDLRQRSVLVKIQAGKTVINKTAKTLHKGFLELWLDCNQTYQVTLKMGGKIITGTLNTQAGSDTCITTMRLQ